MQQPLPLQLLQLMFSSSFQLLSEARGNHWTLRIPFDRGGYNTSTGLR